MRFSNYLCLYYDIIITSRTHCDTQAEELINRAKFNVITLGSFGGVETDRTALYTVDLKYVITVF